MDDAGTLFPLPARQKTDGAALRGQPVRVGDGAPDGRRISLAISGMHCAACVRRVERAASAVPGVSDVAVNLATERVTVTAAPTLRLPDLTAALAKAGYPVVADAIDPGTAAPAHGPKTRVTDGTMAGGTQHPQHPRAGDAGQAHVRHLVAPLQGDHLQPKSELRTGP